MTSKTGIRGQQVSICHVLMYFCTNLCRTENNDNNKKLLQLKSLFSSLAFLKLDLDPFPPEERYEVKVREGVGAVLLCEPPYHYPGNSARSASFSMY